MTRHFTPEETAAAVRRVRAGESVTELARELGVHPTTVRNWRRHVERLERGLRLTAAGVPDPTAPVATPPLPPETSRLLEAPSSAADPGTAQALAAAQAAAGDAGAGTADAEAGAATSSTADAPTSEASSSSPPPAPPKPSELVDLAEGIRAIVVEVAASKYGLALEREQRERLAAIPPGQRKALETLAPHAVKYAPAVLERLDRFAALGFVAIFALGLKTAWSDVAQLAQERAT